MGISAHDASHSALRVTSDCFLTLVTDSIRSGDLVILAYNNQMTDLLNVIYELNSLVLLP